MYFGSGYEDVRQAERVANEGRDILMEEVVDGTRRAIIVECKHTDSVGRPVVQKLHSAIATYDYEGPKRGMVVTSGRSTGPAQEYTAELREAGDPHPIELIDGTDLRELADEIGSICTMAGSRFSVMKHCSPWIRQVRWMHRFGRRSVISRTWIRAMRRRPSHRWYSSPWSWCRRQSMQCLRPRSG